MKFTIKEFVNKAEKIHGKKYDYSKSVYINAFKKIIINCSIHGDFVQIPSNHLSNHGCPKCVGKNKKTKDIVAEFRLVHRNKYDYSLVNYKSAHSKIIIICLDHGIFSQRTDHHLNGSGCPKCSNFISKEEIQFLDYLNIPDTKKTRQLKIGKFNIDGYDPKTNTIYEFLGDYWHGNPENKRFNPKLNHPINKVPFEQLYNNTMEKLDKLKWLGYHVKYIWEMDWHRFKKGLDIFPKIVDH